MQAIDGAALRQHYIEVGMITPADPAEIPVKPAPKASKPKARVALDALALFNAVCACFADAADFFAQDAERAAFLLTQHYPCIDLFNRLTADRIGKIKREGNVARIYRLAAA